MLLSERPITAVVLHLNQGENTTIHNTSMLDKDNLIQEIDSDNIRDTIADLPQQLRQEFDVPVRVEPANLTAVVIAGMGGSVLAGEMLRTWLADQLPVPIILVRGYELPAFVDRNTLVICSSYSGNTEETLGLYNRAGERQAPRVVIASGGQLHERGVSDELPVYQLPTGYQPRMVAWYGLRALAELMEGLGFAAGAVAELEEAARFLAQLSNEWGLEVLTGENRAKQIAEECAGKAVWIYSGPALNSAARKWKIDINENAKHVASWNELPEFNHNEFLGWTEHPRQKPFTVIQLQSALDGERVQKRFEVTNRLLSGRMPAPVVVESRGDSHIQHLLWACLLGDYVSLYLAVLNNVNPGRVEAIEQLKRELD